MSTSVRVSGFGPLVDYDTIRSFFSNCGTVVEVVFLSQLSLSREEARVIDDAADLDCQWSENNEGKENDDDDEINDNDNNVDGKNDARSTVREAIVTFLDRCGACTAVMVTGSTLGGSQITVSEAKEVNKNEKNGNKNDEVVGESGVTRIGRTVSGGAAVVGTAMINGISVVGERSCAVASGVFLAINPWHNKEGPPTSQQHGEGNQPQWGPPPPSKTKQV